MNNQKEQASHTQSLNTPLPGGPAKHQGLTRSLAIVNTEEMDHEDYGKKVTNGAFEHESLDSFVTGMHETTATGETNGLPGLIWIKDNFKTKSAAIRYLAQLGHTPKVIAAHLDIKYQQVYNVTHQHLKRGPNEVYIEQAWQCSHTKATIVIDVVVRRGSRDPDGTRVLYRVCARCAIGLIPGITEDTLNKALPGVKEST